MNAGAYLMNVGFRQVAEWAEAHLDQTTIPEASRENLSDREKAALLLIELMKQGGIK